MYDATSEVHEGVAEGPDREGALAALARATRTVARQVDDSAMLLARERAERFAAPETAVASIEPQPTRPAEAFGLGATELEATQLEGTQLEASRGTSTTLLSLVLALGGASVFLGVLALAVTRWSTVGTTGQLGLIAAFTLATFGGGLALGRRGFPRSGFTLELLALELSWAVAHVAIDGGSATPSTDAWVFAATVIAILHAAHAVRRPTAIVATSSCIALAVASLLLGLEHWGSAPHGAAVYAGAVAALFGGIAYAGKRLGASQLHRPYAIASGALAVASAVGMTCLLALERGGPSTTLEIAWPYLVLGAAFAVTRTREGEVSGQGASLLAPVIVLLPSVQAVLLGIVEAPFWVGAVTIAPLSLGLALATRWVGLRESRTTSLASLVTTAWLLFSSGVALVSFVQSPSFGPALWPFVVAAAAFAASRLAARAEASTVSFYLGTASLVAVVGASSVELALAPWGDTALFLRWLVSLAVTHASAIVVVRAIDPTGRRASLPFALSAVLWSAATTLWALFTMQDHPSPSVIAWPFVAAAFAWLSAAAMPVVDPSPTEPKDVSSAKVLATWSSLLLLGSPSAIVAVLHLSRLGFWVPATLALVGTGLGAAWVFLGPSARPRTAGDEAVPLSPLGLGFLFVGGGWVVESTQAAFRQIAHERGVSIATAWPYLLAAAAFALGKVLERSKPELGLVLRRGSIVVTCLAAAAMALASPDRIGFLVVATCLGVVVAASSLRRHAGSAEPSSIDIVGFAGIACALAPSAVACISKTFGASLDDLLAAHAQGPAGLLYLVVFIIADAAILAIALAADHLEAIERRGVELASVGAFFGVFGLLCLPHLERDYLFMSILFAGGALMIAVGLVKRRVVLVGAAAISLVVETFVQYFAKLHEALPWGFLALGFGVVLLALAFLFERKVRPHLEELSRWA